jgi:coenzyme F420-reducing hydrogenase delta subunit/Pyruvate/2-oxoacid:ferredoxin oxidoreductase delta subunit
MIPQEEFRKIPRVLIWGKGLTAEETEAQLTSLGYEVKTIHPDDPIQLLDIEGFAGDFQVTLGKTIPPFNLTAEKENLENKWTEKVGAIVFAPELVSEGNYSTYQLTPSSQIVTLEEMQKVLISNSDNIHQGDHSITPVPSVCARTNAGRQPSLARGEGILTTLKPNSYVAFLVGLTTEGNVLDMALTLSAAREIRKRYQSQVSIFCRQVKVAGEGMERLYQACRDEGVLFFKFDHDGPLLLKEGDGVVLQFEDTILRRPFKLTPDLLVFDSRHSLPSEIRRLALSAGLGMDKSGFFQPANVHFLPQDSQREGIFFAGPGKGPVTSQVCIEEAGAAALAVHHFFEGRTSEPMNREVIVDKGLCTLCLTCLRFCPHQAIGWTHRIFIHPLACRRCGICASECPMDAIQIAGYSDKEVDARLMALQARWELSEFNRPRIVVFGCQRSAGVAWEAVQSSKFKVQSNVEFISLPCTGKMDPDHILKAFSLGADGVMVLACPEENCRSVHGNTYARERILEIRKYMEEAGVHPDRIRFENLSSNMEWFLKELIRQYNDDLDALRIPPTEIRNGK